MILPADTFEALRDKARAHWAGATREVETALLLGQVPVWVGITATYGLDEHGVVWQFDRGSTEPKRLDGMWRDIAVIFGAKLFSELQPLAPVRTDADATCSQCSGSGKIVINGKALPTPCSCAGLGWVPARWKF